MLNNYTVLIAHCTHQIYIFTSYCCLYINLCIMVMSYLSFSLIFHCK